MLTCKTCNCCPNVLKATSATISGGSLIFSTDSTITPVNGSTYIFKCPISVLPTAPVTTVDQVYVEVNSVNIPFQCKLGNNVYSDQVRCFRTDSCCNIVLRLVYGSTPAHFKIVSQDLCCSTAYGTTAAAVSTSGNTASTNSKAK